MFFRHFVIQRFSVFQILEIGEIIEKIWKIKFGLKIPLSEAKLSFDTPKGVINARKSISTTTNGFSTFSDFWISVFQILEIGEIIEKIWKNKFRLKIPLSEAKLSFDTPKGVINARNKSHSTKTNAFLAFSGILFFNFGFFSFWVVGGQTANNQFWDVRINVPRFLQIL